MNTEEQYRIVVTEKKLLNQTLMMLTIYSMMFLKIVEKELFIHLNIDVCMIFNLKIW